MESFGIEKDASLWRQSIAQLDFLQGSTQETSGRLTKTAKTFDQYSLNAMRSASEPSGTANPTCGKEQGTKRARPSAVGRKRQGTKRAHSAAIGQKKQGTKRACSAAVGYSSCLFPDTPPPNANAHPGDKSWDKSGNEHELFTTTSTALLLEPTSSTSSRGRQRKPSAKARKQQAAEDLFRMLDAQPVDTDDDRDENKDQEAGELLDVRAVTKSYDEENDESHAEDAPLAVETQMVEEYVANSDDSEPIFEVNADAVRVVMM